MKKNNTWTRSLLGAGLALALLAPASAQQVTEPVRGGDSQKPVVSTYNKAPKSSGTSQPLDAATYQKAPNANGNNQSMDAATYDKNPNSDGKDQDLDSVRYREDGAPNQPQGDDVSQVDPQAQPTAEPVSPTKGDSQKPVVRTYENVPEPQSTNPGPRANDVSGVDDSQKPVVQTYDKQPNSSGDEQKLDLIRYEQQNDANDGREPQLEVKVLEGSIEE